MIIDIEIFFSFLLFFFWRTARFRATIYVGLDLYVSVVAIHISRSKIVKYVRMKRLDALCKPRWWLNAVAKDFLNHKTVSIIASAFVLLQLRYLHSRMVAISYAGDTGVL